MRSPNRFHSIAGCSGQPLFKTGRGPKDPLFAFNSGGKKSLALKSQQVVSRGHGRNAMAGLMAFESVGAIRMLQSMG